MGARGKLISKGKGPSLGGDIYELPVDDSQPFSPYYDKNTGRIHERLPADDYSQGIYRKRGLVPGYPPREFEPITKEEPAQQVNNSDTDMLALIKSMQAKIEDLENKLAAKRGEEPAEPVQLSLL